MQKYIVFVTVIFLVLFVSCASSPDKKIFIADIDPFELGKGEAGFDKLFSDDLNQQIIEVIYNARIDAVYLKLKHKGAKIILSLYPGERELLIQKTEQYNNEFESKQLIKGSNKTSKAYGIIQTTMNWGVLSMNAEAKPRIHIGYRFVRNNPYFTLNVRQARNINTTSESDVPESFEFTIHFNRQQAEALAQLISADTINNGLEKQNLPDQSNAPDEY
ncbi:MAG: hypothetical protein JXJ04_18410 [Spirochaetales bacterium]|nr:hypothetical protein [Spirochaetales bacterium]